jgi:subfamily B ATP-binding cassette protein MsbA
MSSDMENIFKKKNETGLSGDIIIFWRLAKPYIRILSAAVVCSLILSGINGAIAWFIKPVLDYIFINKASDLLYLLPIGIMVLFVLRGTFTFLANYLMRSIGAKIAKSLRQNVYNKLLTLPFSFYNKTSSGSIMSRMLNDIEVLNITGAQTFKDFFVQGSTVIVLTAVAFIRRWDLALLSFIVIPFIVYSIGRLGGMMKRISAKTRKLLSKVTTILHESLQGIKIIKAFTMEKVMSERYRKALHEHYRNTMREVRTDEFSRLMAEVLGGIGVVLVVFYGGHLVISEKISTGSFFSFVAAILLIYTPLKRLTKVANNFQQARTIIERLRHIIILESEKQDGEKRTIKGQIELKNVSFSYPGSSQSVLKNINIKIAKGEIIALVGHSGAGKSTLVDLVAGFWYPTGGNIYIDGITTRDLSLKFYREHLGIVSQDIVLFNDTVKANILFGRPNATDNEVTEAWIQYKNR